VLLFWLCMTFLTFLLIEEFVFLKWDFNYHLNNVLVCFATDFFVLKNEFTLRTLKFVDFFHWNWWIWFWESGYTELWCDLFCFGLYNIIMFVAAIWCNLTSVCFFSFFWICRIHTETSYLKGSYLVRYNNPCSCCRALMFFLD